MSILDDEQNRNYMGELKRNINNIVPFLGAGASIPYGYPSWPDLISKVLTVIHDVCEMTETNYQKIKDLISEGQYISATEEMSKCWPNLENYVCQEISMINPTNDSCLKKYIHLFPSHLYLTTNYDAVVENILKHYWRNLNVIITTSPIPDNIGLRPGAEPMLCYLHGKHTNPNSIIFSNADYNYFYGPEKAADIKSVMRQFLAKKLQEVYLRDPILFIGCSMSINQDRILKLLKKFNQMGQKPGNFSYALLDATGLDLDRRRLKESELLSIMVHPIWYENDHEQAKNDLFEYLLGEKRKEFENRLRKQKEKYDMERKKQEEKEEELKKLEKEIEESSEIQDKFQYAQKYYGTNCDYEFVLIKGNNQYYLSDQGRTHEMLDKIFELKEPDVIKNLTAIAKECDAQFIGDKLLVVLESWNDSSEEEQKQLIEKVKCKLFSCVSFMDKMRIFYV